jgi:hypothetical protein
MATTYGTDWAVQVMVLQVEMRPLIGKLHRLGGPNKQQKGGFEGRQKAMEDWNQVFQKLSNNKRKRLSS